MGVADFIKSKIKKDVKPVNIPDEAYFNSLYNEEFSRLANQVYLDFTGGGLYSKSQVLKHQAYLLDNVLGNPHSSNPTSKKSTEQVELTRDAVKQYFNAEDYCCVFTANASAALKIIGESYPFSAAAHLALLMDNHNSVNGIREFALNKGASFEFIEVDKETLTINEIQLQSVLNNHKGKTCKLFGFPAQSNVSGVKHNLDWISYAESRGWDVLLDAAAFVPTSRLDLSQVKPSFVSMSFYKIFGYPTGLGCLLIRKDKYERLHKPWFAGGTVSMVSNKVSKHFLMANHERFEDGTINYLDIPAIKIGLDFINSIGIDRITTRISNLRKYLYHSLSELKHNNGQNMVELYGPTDDQAVGGTVIFNVLDLGGNSIPYYTVEEAANQYNISIRSGCFCNPGLDEINHNVEACQIQAYYENVENPTIENVLTYFGSRRGAVRASVGIPTRKDDIDQLIDCLKKEFGK